MVRAKFKVVTVKPSMYMQPVMPKWDPEKREYDKMDENARFWDATPSGSITMQINNPEGFKFFMDRMTKTFYVDFTEAPE